MHKKLLAVFLAVLITLTAIMPVSAQQAGQGLEISPPLVDMNVDPGKVISFKIKLRNITRGTLVATPRVEDFVAQGEEGQAKLLIDSKEPSPYSFKEWVQPMSKLTIPSQKQQTATVTLNVPQDASPGGHYGVVRFTAAPPELEDTGVALSASIGTLVLINVSGDIKRVASLAEYYVHQNGKKGSFFEKGPVSFVERLKNDGNVHFRPTGTLRITNIFGKEVAVLSINERGGNVLPGSIRRFEQDLKKNSLFGRYKAELNVQYGGQQDLRSTINFWVIPYKLIAIILGALILIYLILRYFMRSYADRAVRKATGQSKTTKTKKTSRIRRKKQ